MSATNAGPGRPAGVSEATLARGRLYLELLGFGLTVNEIAARAGLARSEVYRVMNLARPLAPDPQLDQATEKQPATKPRKMSEGALLRHAWTAMHKVAAFRTLLDADTREFWVEVLMEIRDGSPDGIELMFGNPGDLYSSQAEFVASLGREPSQLKQLFHHSMLVDLGGGGIAMPFRWGFRDRPAGHVGRKKVPNSPLPFPLHVVDGGRSSAPISPDSESGKTPISPDSESGKTPISPDIFPDSDNLAPAAAAAAYAKDKNALAAAAAADYRAGESGEMSGETPILPDSESGNIIPQRSPLADLTAELVVLAGLGRAANADDLGAVQAWAKAGDTPDEMGDGIKIKRGQINGKAIRSLAYFDGFMEDARKKRNGEAVVASAPAATDTPAAPSPASATPLSPEDQAIRDRLRAVKHAYPPSLAAFKYPEKAAQARRWLDVGEAWVQAGRRADLKPPDFTLASLAPSQFEEDLLAIELALTEPVESG